MGWSLINMIFVLVIPSAACEFIDWWLLWMERNSWRASRLAAIAPRKLSNCTLNPSLGPVETIPYERTIWFDLVWFNCFCSFLSSGLHQINFNWFRIERSSVDVDSLFSQTQLNLIHWICSFCCVFIILSRMSCHLNVLNESQVADFCAIRCGGLLLLFVLLCVSIAKKINRNGTRTEWTSANGKCHYFGEREREWRKRVLAIYTSSLTRTHFGQAIRK